MTASPALEVRGLVKRFGGLLATNEVSLALAPGERHALIGPNGAGKTTLVNLVTGRLRPSAGQVLLRGADVTELSAADRVRRGLARTFQVSQLFPGLTLLESVALAVQEHAGQGWRMLRPPDRAALDRAAALLDQVGLGALASLRTTQAAYGHQRMVEIAMALALEPAVLLLDEPAAGVPAAEAHRILHLLERLPPETAVLVVEHDMDLVFRFAQQVTVLHQGAVLARGTPAQVGADAEVRRVYLGRRRTLGAATAPAATLG